MKTPRKTSSRLAGWFRPRSDRPVRPRKSTLPLRLETLEDRCVLSPTVFDPNLGVRTVVSGLTQPTNMAFLGANDFFVIEKASGQVKHIVNGVNAGPVLDLAVNSASERGLLGIALSPNFANDHNVYLYWTESTATDPTTGARVDSTVLGNVPLLGNRIDRFIWNGSTLTFDKNIIRLHAFQNDGNGGQPTQQQGNHNGGVIKFGPDGKLYIVIGDNGRRGWMQNLVNGPFGPGVPDDQFGGPAPDDNHLTGVMLRLNPDGSIPDDNPFSDIKNSLSAVLRSTHSIGSGSFTAFLNQAEDNLTINVTFQALGTPTLAGGGNIRFGGATGPVILNVPDFPGGEFTGEVTTSIAFSSANFFPDPADGINTFDDAIQAILNGKTSFSISTEQFPDGEISGAIAQLNPQVTTNLHKVFAYGIRNTFGFDFDPVTGKLWLDENGDDSFDKISLVEPGANNGWIQTDGPLSSVAEFKAIETGRAARASYAGLQQDRWNPLNIADTPEEALNRMLMLPGAFYNPPQFAFRYAVPPAGLGFMTSSALGPQYEGALFMGGARDGPNFLANGYLMVFHPTSDRTGLDFSNDPNVRASDHVFQNFDKNQIKNLTDGKDDTNILIGRDFGVGTDILTGPNGDLYVVSLTQGAVYEIFNKNNVVGFQQKNLVADVPNPPGGAPTVVDPNLKNPWGISFSTTSPFWVSNQASGTSTLYSGDVTQPNDGPSPITKVPLTVTIPPAAGRTQGTPTGQVFNPTADFLIPTPSDGKANFIFANIDGTIAAWNGAQGTTAVTVATTSGAVYTGLAIGSNSTGNFLYAANTRQNRIDVFDKAFKPAVLAGGFFDPSPDAANFTPFNIQNLNGTLYVAYRSLSDPEHGGIVDTFDTNGNFLSRVVTGGVNRPWGLAFAPANFGPYSNDFLVGNEGLGDGKINVYDPKTGAFLGNLTDTAGNPLSFERLWAITPGNGGAAGDKNALYFDAGINAEADGLFGSLRFVPKKLSGDGTDEEGDGSGAGGAGGLPGSGTPGFVQPLGGDGGASLAQPLASPLGGDLLTGPMAPLTGTMGSDPTSSLVPAAGSLSGDGSGVPTDANLVNALVASSTRTELQTPPVLAPVDFGGKPTSSGETTSAEGSLPVGSDTASDLAKALTRQETPPQDDTFTDPIKAEEVLG